MNIIDIIEQEGMRKDLPELRVGDTIVVYVKVIEGNRERVQAYEGTLIARKNSSIRETITVRHITKSGGFGVERTFPLHSPKIDRIEVKQRGYVRRAKLYYLRERSGKSAKVRPAKNAIKNDK